MAHEGPLYDAAAKMMDLGLRQGDSLFTPGYPVWTLATAEDFQDRFITKGDVGKDSFMVKLKRQLDNAPRATAQLAAELLYVYLLPPVSKSIGIAKKRALLQETLECSPETVVVPADLDQALDGGFASTGTAYNTERDRQISYLIRFLIAFRKLPADRQVASARDPRMFRALADDVPIRSAQSMRNALLHLAFPDFFQDTVSDKQKSQIAKAFGQLITSSDANVDEQLLEIRGSLERDRGRPISFYDDDIRAIWDPIGHPPPPPPPPPPGRNLPDATSELAAKLLVDQSWLNETIDLLREKRQLILYGPPGTGKTYLAQALAEYLAKSTDGEYRLVQFHPSYSYEDFFEGFRPTPGDHSGTISFELVPGPFKMLAAEATANPEHAYILVIDEINRANLAKVFGELYFLLEYRDRKVSLQYSPREWFQLPNNLYVIGTMNTSDRSIALVDAAMRRRFNWQALFPDQPPVKDLLRRWLKLHNLPGRAAYLLDALNAKIEDKDGKVGPSYLMTERAKDDLGIRRIWEHQILPLLEERHAGEGVDVRGWYGVDALDSATSIPGYPGSAVAPVEQEEGE
ncbi:MAG TPA: AAA family ATPase [Candidatus Nanopelagicaceae bacterium]|nr:AAA family ATPase [Candidatus Nanopelagicaceae bacterium]